MKIKNITVSAESINLSRPYTIAFNTYSDVKVVLVRIETFDGFIGYGSGSPSVDVTGETQAMSLTSLESNVFQSCIGVTFTSPYEVLEFVCKIDSESLLVRTPAALAAFDIALFDLFSKMNGKPLVDFLGRQHKSLPTSITLGIQDTSELMLEEAREYIDRGFKVLKLKLGKDLQLDIEYTKALRATVPKSTVIYVDPNQGYSIEEFKSYLKLCEPLNIDFVEQPVSKDLTHDLITLLESEKKVVCVDESLQSLSDAQSWEKNKQFPGNIFNIKLMKCGGLRQAGFIAYIAKRNNLKLMFGCMDESCVSIAAALHFAYAQSNTRYIDLDGSLDLEKDLFSGGFEIIDGMMHTLDKPGLGVTPIK